AALCCKSSAVLLAERLPTPHVRGEPRACRRPAKEGLSAEKPRRLHHSIRVRAGKLNIRNALGFSDQALRGASSAFSGCGRIGMPPAAVGSYAADWENVPQGGELRPHGGTLVNGRGFPVNHHKLEAGNIEGAKLGSCCFPGIGLMRRSPSPAISGPDHT